MSVLHSMKSTLEFGKIWFNYYSQFMLPLLWNTIITWLLLSHLVCWNESPNYAAFFCYASWKIMASVALKHSALITWLCSHIFYTGRCPKLHEYMLENYLDRSGIGGGKSVGWIVHSLGPCIVSFSALWNLGMMFLQLQLPR